MAIHKSYFPLSLMYYILSFELYFMRSSPCPKIREKKTGNS